jgi:ABC-type branched-subunit amino acid transport system permease subunit
MIIIKFDKPTIVILIACLATIPYEIFTRVLLFFGIGKYSLYQLNSFVITITENRPDPVIGFIVSIAVGGVFGLLFYYSLEKLGTDYLILKAIFSSIFLWVILELVFTSTIEGKTISIRPISDYYVKMLGSIIFGITLGVLFRIFLFKKPISKYQ